MILCDDALKNLFGVAKFEGFKMQTLISAHFKAADEEA